MGGPLSARKFWMPEHKHAFDWKTQRCVSCGAEMMAKPSERFELGQLMATPGAIDKVGSSTWAAALARHAKGDWGNMPPEDVTANNQALREGSRLMSSYLTPQGVKFWIITEADRSVTTILLPEEY